MEQLLYVMLFFSGVLIIVGIIAAYKGSEERMAVFGYLSVVLFAVFFGFCCWTISMNEDYQESTIMDYCNGKITIDTVAVTNDGKLYEIKIRRK